MDMQAFNSVTKLTSSLSCPKLSLPFVEDESETPTPDDIAKARWIDIFSQDDDGNSALILAVAENRLHSVKLILMLADKVKAVPEVLEMENNKGETALSVATRLGHYRCTQAIMEYAKNKRRNPRTHLKFTEIRSFVNDSSRYFLV
ncbi:unnamed protein product [Toxocara canis]|uniref:ANK_REP_REGION domain-containing protein n=1 Tax=Toxocara canis TaxID=6265 RepID=A0A183UPH8_TOXCA|nr:unnamed protein product [Toxocara canis]